MSDTGQTKTWRQPADFGSPAQTMAGMIRSIIAQHHHVLLAQVVNVAQGDIVRVDVMPMLQPITADGQALQVAMIWGIPIFRAQAGNSAIIIDPVPGDVGLVLVADRDISAIIGGKAAATPASQRVSSPADGVYLGGIWAQAITQFVKMDAMGVEIVSPEKVTISAPLVRIEGAQIEIHGPVTHTGGNIVTDGDMIASDVSVIGHTHGGIRRGNDDTDPPN